MVFFFRDLHANTLSTLSSGGRLVPASRRSYFKNYPKKNRVHDGCPTRNGFNKLALPRTTLTYATYQKNIRLAKELIAALEKLIKILGFQMSFIMNSNGEA